MLVAVALILLASLSGLGLATRNDAAPHAISAQDLRFPKADFREPRKPSFFERHGGFIPADAGAHCEGMGPWRRSYPTGASQIYSTELACPQARMLVREARRHKACKADDCTVAGFECRDVDAYTQHVQIVCRDHGSQVAWWWTGGY